MNHSPTTPGSVPPGASVGQNSEVRTERVLRAAREAVWEAHADPARLARWWGPAGFANSFHEFDFRPGGHWRFVMHGPDGVDYPNHNVFDEVVKPERIVFRHLDPFHVFRMTITLDETAGATRLTWQMRFESAAHCHEVRSFVTQANEQNLDRLEAELARFDHASKP